MGWLREKYTRSYFTGTDEEGNIVPAAEGFDAYQAGEARDFNKALLEWVDFQGMRVLDIGFGRGEMMKYAKDRGASHVAGVDFSQAAYDLADELFEKFNIDAEIYCDDVLNFVNGWLERDDKQKFDIVLMFDVVEHVPRSELSEALLKLRRMISEKAIVLINTPVFAVDNDVVKDGLDPRAMDTSDEYDNTKGMHCNRYTKRSLQFYMASLGYTPVSGHYFVNSLNLPFTIAGTRVSWLLAQTRGYPLRLNRLWKEEKFELGQTLKEHQQYVQRHMRQNPLSLPKQLAVQALRKVGLQRIPRPPVERIPQPRWVTIKDGLLAGRDIFIDPESPAYWPSEMAMGTYDDALFDIVAELINAKSTIIWDVGAHLGYHTMALAKLATPQGKVIAFEPNPYSVQRYEKIMERNPDIATTIELLPIALSDYDGEAEFLYSTDIDFGQSCGSHLVDTATPYDLINYASFQEMSVRVAKVDTLIKQGELPVPQIMKIDVEGAEREMLLGSKNLLEAHHPTLLLEIHSASNVLHVQQFLNELGYQLNLIEDDHASPARCFVIAKHGD
ncbi:MAG: FkbM family methyltransferase [Aggregatilineales bacterium]